MSDERELTSVRVSRRHGDHVAEGEVRMPEASADEGCVIAAALAWESLGRGYLDAGDAGGAVAAAEAGLEELGEPPPDDDIVDDTELKLYAAQERVSQGHTADGAANMLDILRVRAGLYAGALHGHLVD